MWVYNSQNATPDVQRVNQLARAAHIPITTITETLSPASATFEQWQVAELRNLQQALHQATGKMSPPPTIDAAPVPRGRDARVGAFLGAGGAAAGRAGTDRRPYGLERCELRDRGRESSPRSSDRTGQARRRCCACCSASCRSRAGTASVFGRAPGEASGQIGYLPQRRHFDASVRIRGIDLVRLGLDGARWGLPLRRSVARAGSRR